jgi:hypothetical protein
MKKQSQEEAYELDQESSAPERERIKYTTVLYMVLYLNEAGMEVENNTVIWPRGMEGSSLEAWRLMWRADKSC